MHNFERFEYTDDNIFEHALRKIGEMELLLDNLSAEQKYELRTLKDEYARIRDYHLHGTEGKQTTHSKTATLRPCREAGEGWFYKPSDWHGPGTTHVKDQKMIEGTELILIDSEDGEITYKAQGKKYVECIEDAPLHLKDHIFREFCVQAAIICDCDEDIVDELRAHHGENKVEGMFGTFTEMIEKWLRNFELLIHNYPPSYGTSGPIPEHGYSTTAIANWIPNMSQLSQGIAMVPQLVQTANALRGAIGLLK